ncbi:MAG: polysaccharide deacetylase family protein [Thaumarchaeota archaeon]|nr:polysaccharide deacetylase family protein [Nitrososphaerota archaeon]
MQIEPTLSFRIDDVPEWPDVRQAENLAQALEKHKTKATLAICGGWLRDWEVVQPPLKRAFDEGLVDIACHGMYHEDFGGIGEVGSYGGKDHYFRPLTLPQTHDVLAESQAFAKQFFGETYKVFIACGANHVGLFVPKELTTFYEILRVNGFKAIANYPGINGVDPLVRVAKRTPDICEIPFTVYVDFYRRSFFKNLYEPANFDKYFEAAKSYIKTRFDAGLFSVVMLHMINFYPDPIPESSYAGGNPGGIFIDRIMTWVKDRYPKVRVVGMSDLIELAE